MQQYVNQFILILFNLFVMAGTQVLIFSNECLISVLGVQKFQMDFEEKSCLSFLFLQKFSNSCLKQTNSKNGIWLTGRGYLRCTNILGGDSNEVCLQISKFLSYVLNRTPVWFHPVGSPASKVELEYHPCNCWKTSYCCFSHLPRSLSNSVSRISYLSKAKHGLFPAGWIYFHLTELCPFEVPLLFLYWWNFPIFPCLKNVSCVSHSGFLHLVNSSKIFPFFWLPEARRRIH